MPTRAARIALAARNDVLTGRNLELYALGVLALVFSIISFFNEPPFGVAFAIGAVYCAELIGERHRRESQDKQIKEMIDLARTLVEIIESPQTADEIRHLNESLAQLRTIKRPR